MTDRSLRMAAAIVGASETEQIGVIPDKSALQLHAEAAILALKDAGIDKSEVDGLLSTASPAQLAEYLQITPTYVDGTSVGGCSYMIHVAHAAMALATGRCKVALITHGQSGRSRVGETGRWGGAATPAGQFEEPYGVWGPPSRFTIPIVRYMHEYGLTEEQLASVAVAQRKWAALNPRAMMRDPITVEDVLNSRLICWPVHLLECCLVTDGGGALVMVSADRAKDFPKKPVYVMGFGESVEMGMISQMHDFTTSRAFVVSSREAFAMAGITHRDVNHVMIYDAFAHLPIFGMEDMGFLKKGEAGPWFAEMRSAPGGELPVNTNGGGLSYTHTGMYGMFAILESVRQLRGEAAAQVEGVRISVAHGVGGMFHAAGTLVLTNDPDA
ncbi:MAG TPA: acetyl-CoA acetyltransferase [Dehalococcoidia bacterium]|nr:acetyl-CoA acetyltransferase [Dehalococcoidia bacterium]